MPKVAKTIAFARDIAGYVASHGAAAIAASFIGSLALPKNAPLPTRVAAAFGGAMLSIAVGRAASDEVTKTTNELYEALTGSDLDEDSKDAE